MFIGKLKRSYEMHGVTNEDRESIELLHVGFKVEECNRGGKNKTNFTARCTRKHFESKESAQQIKTRQEMREEREVNKKHSRDGNK